jgi:restriction system protein
MRRRRAEDEGFFDVLLVIFRETPWWVGPPVIVGIWILIGVIIPAILGSGLRDRGMAGTEGLSALVQTIFGFLGLAMAGIATIVWLVALSQKGVRSRRLDSMSGIDSIRRLHWRSFEELLAEAFRRQGYAVEESPMGADGGVDLVVSRDGRRSIVQAKQWKVWKVGVKIVRELLGVQIAEQADGAILVTSGRLTAEALAFAEANGIEVIDGTKLETMIQSVQRSSSTRPTTQPSDVDVPTESNRPFGAPTCPRCNATMVERVAHRGAHAGERFWGCSTYPACRGTRTMVSAH